jgi:hypothetical protein
MNQQQILQTFLSHENMQLLWEVIIDDDNKILQTKTREGLAEINQSFNQNIKLFYEKEVKDKISDPSKPLGLVDMNKRFITSMTSFLHKRENKDYEFKALNQIQQVSTEKKAAITKEEIGNERKNNFEKELESKRNDFTTTISKPVPPVPNFQDNISDFEKPLNLEEEMKRIVEQRQYDTIPIPSVISSLSSSLLEDDVKQKTQGNDKSTTMTTQQLPDWLKPQETKESVRFLKIGEEVNPIDIDKYNSKNTNKNTNTPSINQSIVSNLNSVLKQKKNISWSDQLESEDIYEDTITQNTNISTSKNSLDYKLNYIISKINTFEQELTFIKSKL